MVVKTTKYIIGTKETPLLFESACIGEKTEDYTEAYLYDEIEEAEKDIESDNLKVYPIVVEIKI